MIIDTAIKALRAKYDPQIEEKKEKIAQLTEEKRDLMDFIDREQEVVEERKFYADQVLEQKNMHDALIAGIEKDRIKQIDKLRKDMLM